MSFISKGFAKELTNKEARDAYLAAQARTRIVSQIRAIRSQRGWSQAEFAKRLGKPQSNVSQRLENREYGGFTLSTLLEIAATFDSGLVVEFVPYADFIKRTHDLSPTALAVAPFDSGSLTSLCSGDAYTKIAREGGAIGVTRKCKLTYVCIGLESEDRHSRNVATDRSGCEGLVKHPSIGTNSN